MGRRRCERLYAAGHEPLPSQAEVIGAVNDAAGERDVVVCAAGSMPGDLHKLWRARDPKGYHVEYGYSCMGYEIPGGMGVKLAAPEREVFVMVGDGSYLMLPGELPTAVAEGIKLVIVLVQNHGYASIGALSRSVGGAGYGTHYRVARERAGADRRRPRLRAAAGRPRGQRGEPRRAGAAGADDRRVRAAPGEARAHAGGPVVVHVETDRYEGVPSYESWWDVPVAEVGGRRGGAGGAGGVRARARRRQRAYVEGAVSDLVVRGRRVLGHRRRDHRRHARAGGLEHVGFEASARARRSASSATPATRECCVVVIAGHVHRALRARRLARLGGRADAVRRRCPTPPTCPPGTRFTVEGATAEVGLCFAPAGDGAPARVLPGDRGRRPRRAATAPTSAPSTRS